MKIIITGGAGFIASHIADAYIKAGHKVVIIDNLLTGFKKNINPKAKFYEADIRDLAQMEAIFKKERPEIVNHHAAIAEVVKSLNNPIPTYQTNVLGTANVLLAFGKYGRGKHRKFIFSSTGGAMYGAPKKLPVNELQPRTPLSAYGASKLLGEELIIFYARQYGFSYLIFRYANVYGPRQNPKGEAGVVAIFGGLMKAGKSPIIFGDGTKARDYIFALDVAQANLLALHKGKNMAINLGAGKLISDKMIYESVARTLGFTKKPAFAPYRKGEVYKISIDATKAKKILGWKSTVALDEGIALALASI
jgi:UDP-glucose 4-epimerase